MKVTIRQIGPGMVQQMQSVCPECRGNGAKTPQSTTFYRLSGLLTIQYMGSFPCTIHDAQILDLLLILKWAWCNLCVQARPLWFW